MDFLEMRGQDCKLENFKFEPIEVVHMVFQNFPSTLSSLPLSLDSLLRFTVKHQPNSDQPLIRLLSFATPFCLLSPSPELSLFLPLPPSLSLPETLSLFLSSTLRAVLQSPSSDHYLDTCARKGQSMHTETAGHGFPATQSSLLAVVGHVQEGHTSSPTYPTILQLTLTAKLGANKFPSASLSQRYQPFTMKVLESSAPFLVQK